MVLEKNGAREGEYLRTRIHEKKRTGGECSRKLDLAF
jgi:hypothetical protein